MGDDENESNDEMEAEKENKHGIKLKKISKSEKTKRYKTKSRKSLQINMISKKKKKMQKNKRPKRVHSQSVDIPKSKFKADHPPKSPSAKLKSRSKKRKKKEKKSLELNEAQTAKIIKSKQPSIKSSSSKKCVRKRAASVKQKRRKSQVKDIDVCKNKVKNSIFRREKGHKKSFDEIEEDNKCRKQRKHSKSITSYSYNSLLNEQNNDSIDHWMKDEEEKKDHSMTRSVNTTFKKIEEKLKDGLIEPGSTQYFEELDNAMIKLKKEHQK